MIDLKQLCEDRRLMELGHDWTSRLEEIYRLVLAIDALPTYPQGRMRAVTSQKGHVYIFREWYPAAQPHRPAIRIQYFCDGHWHDTVEGVDFDEIRPWIVHEPVEEEA